MYKAANFGSDLIILIGTKKQPCIVRFEVEDCKKQLNQWKPVKKIEEKNVGEEWIKKFEDLWIEQGKVMINISMFDLLTL